MSNRTLIFMFQGCSCTDTYRRRAVFVQFGAVPEQQTLNNMLHCTEKILDLAAFPVPYRVGVSCPVPWLRWKYGTVKTADEM